MKRGRHARATWMREFGLSDQELFPLLDEAGAQLLRRLREHPQAPRYNYKTGERLTAESLARVRAFAESMAMEMSCGPSPPWLMPFIDRCRQRVPFYRQRRVWSGELLTAIPITTRDNLREQPWSFVPDDQSLDQLIAYTTSGTSTSRLQIPATPELPARYLPLIQFMLRRVNVALEGGSRVSIAHVCAQRGTVQHCSISSYLGGAGVVKVNLDPAGWNDPADAARFINDCNPEIYTGDPFAFWTLMSKPLRRKPKAIISSGTSLAAALRQRMSQHFTCPVIDMYSMNETGPIAFSIEHGIHEPLPHQIHVEILDEAGRPAAARQRGQIVVTGGINDCLPLVRYATGDYAGLDQSRRLVNLLGRAPVTYRDAEGRWFSSIDVSTALSGVPVGRLSLKQRADGSLLLAAAGESDAVEQCLVKLRELFGREQVIEVAADGAMISSGKHLEHACEIESEATLQRSC